MLTWFALVTWDHVTIKALVQDCRGFVPSYTAKQQEELQGVLNAARLVFEEAFDSVVDHKTGEVWLFSV